LRELVLHLLDIVENSVSAHANKIIIEVSEDTRSDLLHMRVLDDGIGMNEEMVAKIIDPFVTSRTTRKVGLGIPLLKAAAEACDGYLKIQSAPGKGTCIDVEFKRSHIDRMPLGDLTTTILELVVGTPQVHWVFNYRVNDKEFVFDDEPIKKELEGVSLTEPEVITFIRQYLADGINELHLN
jgi:anti-sigma regulatory factor (Ser/Thr protein kinase)